MTQPMPAANWYLTRRHYSTDLKVDPYPRGAGEGLRGRAICDPHTDVRDQTWLDEHSVQYPHLAKRKVSDLPKCKRCVKAVTGGAA